MGGPQQHRLTLQVDPGLTMLEHALDHVVDLRLLVQRRHEQRTLRRAPRREELLRESLGRESDDGVRRVEDRLGRAIVLFQGDDVRRRRKLARKVEDVAHGRGSEGVDGLRVVAHHREPAAVGLQGEQDAGLERVRILVLVDQHVVEVAAHGVGGRGFLHQVKPVQQQVIVIEEVAALLGLDVAAEQPLQLSRPPRTPRECPLERLLHGAAGVHGMGVDREAGGLLGKPCGLPGEPQFRAHQVQEVGRVRAVEHGERRIELEPVGVVAQQAIGDGVKRPGPGDPGRP